MNRLVVSGIFRSIPAKLFELSRRPGIYELLARSLAPSIWETDDVKKGILLQLFGGTNKSIARGGGGGGPRYRGDINVLLVGDPGTSKSQILQVATLDFIFSWMCAPTGFSYSGALVLSDGGVCCIDEFDKMSDATRSVLHEVMEQQTVSIAKAGIITTLNARTSIIAAANPVGSKYDVNLPISRNIDLPPTLISRFDLLYLVLDRVDEAMDRKLAQHLAGLYLEDTRIRDTEDILWCARLERWCVLHEVMEQQTVSIAKAGIITTLNARTSIIAAANPVGSKYDVNPPISRNIDLPPTLIPPMDRKLAQHLAGLYLEDTSIRDTEDILYSGALVLSDGGVCCIDEFDKMSDATRSVLHEVMEQQTVSIAKAGIITTLNARTSIIAAANPVGSKYDVNPPISRNIDLPPTLISRFDLLYLVLDRVDEAMDRKLAQHLAGLYLEDTPIRDTEDILPLQELSAYIDYARSKIHPVITEAAGTELVSSYVEMRNMGDDPRASEKRITATTRQLESMIRLSEAHARMRFSEFVELQDVKEACRLMREAIRTSADSRTGKIDMGMLNTGTGQGRRKMRDDMRKEVLGLLQGAGGARGIKWSEAIKRLGDQSSVKVDVAEFSEVIKGLENEGLVKVVGERDKRTIRRIEG
ncbi:hypothetical protein D9615_010664 [Tricholomella constricta]|uniref:DNA replication licensing factor MCM4 n=1 Tax=Tricholomella constricta TaxID=117010 RepID=A0A8H5GKF6_9AGAR|nr:hypothetical protein D9615_010664 [Tricholomella constricta]